MKYNEQLFDMSKLAKMSKKQESDNKSIKDIQRRLLKIMVEELRKAMIDPRVINDGYVKILFTERFYRKPDEGYAEIKELIKSNNFYNFASEYCIYLTGVENRCDEYYSAYYELTWDFTTYFNLMKKEATQRKLRPNNKKGGF